MNMNHKRQETFKKCCYGCLSFFIGMKCLANPDTTFGVGMGTTYHQAHMSKSPYGPPTQQEYYDYGYFRSQTPFRAFLLLDYTRNLSVGVEFQNWSKFSYQETQLRQTMSSPIGQETSEYQAQLFGVRVDWRWFPFNSSWSGFYSGLQLGFAAGKGRVVDKKYQATENREMRMVERHTSSFSIFQPQGGLLIGWRNRHYQVQLDMLPLALNHPHEDEEVLLWNLYLNAGYRF